MSITNCNITNFDWIKYESIGFPSNNIASLCLFRDSVVRPSLNALDFEIERLQGSANPAANSFADDYAEIFQTTVEGYLITVQSMWERSLRSMLILRGKELGQDANLKKIERATWEILQDHFQRLMGVSLQEFRSYLDLDFLQTLANAIRHGDGPSARKLHQLRPDLWFNWIASSQKIEAGSFQIIASLDGPEAPSFNSITLSESMLEQIIESVICFWADVVNIIRKN